MFKSIALSRTQSRSFFSPTDASAVEVSEDRRYNCGELRAHHIGRRVTLSGWVQRARSIGDDLGFVVLRDGYGTTQLLLHMATGASMAPEVGAVNVDGPISLRQLLRLPVESVVSVTGTVVSRPEDMANDSMATGDVEVEVHRTFWVTWAHLVCACTSRRNAFHISCTLFHHFDPSIPTCAFTRGSIT